MKKTLFTLFLLAALPLRTLAYDFSAVAPTGQTLYYNIVNGEAQVTYPFIPIIHWYGHTKPTGDLIIPDSVVHSSSGITYAVTSIRDTTFYNCTGLTSVTLPNSLTAIGKSAFGQCFGLTGTLTIPNSVTSIGNLAFGYCPGLTSVTIGNSVTSIGNGAFRNCTGLTGTLTIPNSVTYIGNDAFENCTGLTGTLTIPNSVTSIGDYAFFTCSGLTSVSIGDSVTSIGNYAFSNCSGLTSATIGTRVTSIGRGAFKDCIALTTVNFNADSCTFPGNVSNRVFMNCPITVLYIGNNVRRIPNHAFYRTPLVSLTIPDSVTSIGMSAFYFCRSLVSLTIGNSVSTIGDSAFFFNDRLSSLTIPNSVTTIGNYAFRRNEALTSVTIGNSVTTIGNGAFQYCEALANVILLNETAPVLGQEAFFSYNGNRYYHIPCGSYDSYYNGTGWVFYRSRLIAPPMPAFTVDVAVDNEAQGEAGITSPVSCDSTCIISATPQFGYHFSHWSNGSTANPDTLHLTGDSTVTAHFAPNTYTVSAYSNDDSLGYATGGSGLYLDTITLTATITAPHHHFSHWDDGNTANPRAYCITGDTSFTAFFVVDTHTVTVLSIDTTLGTVSGGGTYTAGSTITLTATAHEGYRFVQWQDGNTDNPRMVTIESDTVYTAIFEEVVPMQQYTVTVNANNDTMGMVYGGGTYDEGTVITLTATANSGYRFVQWQDSTTQNPRTVTVTGDATYTATFEQEVSIEDVESVSLVLAPNPTTGLLHVKSSSEVLRLEVYNLQGSMLHSADGEASVDLTVQAAGTYMVRVVTASGTSVHRVVKR